MKPDIKNKEEFVAWVEQNNILKRNTHIEYWNNLKQFNTVDDIPNDVQYKDLDWSEFYVPRLIKAGAIPKIKLVDGATYIGNCRNATEAVWDAKRNVFVYIRWKFGYNSPEDINHFEDDDGYDLFIPIKIKE